MASRHKELRLMALKFGQVLTLKEVWYVKQTVRKHFLFGIFMSAMKWPWYISIRASITIVSSDILGFKHHCSISFGNDMNMMLWFCMDTMKTGLTCHGFFRYPSSKDLYPKWITKKKLSSYYQINKITFQWTCDGLWFHRTCDLFYLKCNLIDIITVSCFCLS